MFMWVLYQVAMNFQEVFSNFFNFFEYFLLMVIYIIESGFTEEGFWLDIGVLSHMYMNTEKGKRKIIVAL